MDLYFSHAIIVSFFFASHSSFLTHPALFDWSLSRHSILLLEQSMSLPEQSILVQLPHGSAQPVGTLVNVMLVSVLVKWLTL
jgi:hypothetical protein